MSVTTLLKGKELDMTQPNQFILFPLALIPGLENPKMEFSFAVSPEIKMSRGKPDLITKKTFDEFEVPVDGDMLQYDTQLIIRVCNKHLVDPDIAIQYPELQRSLRRYPHIIEQLAHGEIKFNDVSRPCDYPNTHKEYVERIWMSQFLDTSDKKRPEITPLTRDSSSIAGLLVDTSLKAMGHVIINTWRRMTFFLTMEDTDLIKEAFLRLHAEPWFRKMMQDIRANINLPKVVETAPEQGDNNASEDDAPPPPTVVETPRKRKTHKRSARGDAKSKADKNQSNASVTSTNVPAPTTNLGAKLAEAGVTSVPATAAAASEAQA